MTFKSLEELNREFMSQEMNRSKTPDREPISEKYDKTSEPEKQITKPAPGKQNKKPAPGKHATKPVPEKNISKPAPGKQGKKPVPENQGKKPEPEKMARATAPAETNKARPPRKKVRSALSVTYWILFYTAILLVLFAILTGSSYSFFTVTSGGATDEIPQGTFLLVHRTDPQELKVGDLITYMRNRSTAEVHEISEIYDNYLDSGSRGFGSKSSIGTTRESDVLISENIIGKVMYVIPVIGTTISWLNDNITVVFIVFGLHIVLFLAIMTKKSKKRGKYATPPKTSGRKIQEAD